MNQTFPYPGLRPFERDETDIFFGREDHTDQLLEKLGQNRFLAVVGPSGCGKSSLVRTGLLAGLEGGLLTSAGIYWHIAEMRPGNHPFAHLAEALLADSALGNEYINHFTDKTEAQASLQATLRRGPLSLCQLCQEAQFDTDTRLLLLVDQFEELFRYYQQGEVEETAAFVALLLASYQNPNIYVIITMRSDFIGDCAAFYGLPEAVNAGLYLTPRLTREQLSEAIALPATVFEGTVEEGLLNRLLNDAGNDPDQLPIIQHALMRMWPLAARAEENVLTLAHYEQIGGFKKALSNHADKAYDELTTAQQKIAEILFRNLSERDNNKRDTRRPTPLREIARLAEVEWQGVVPVVEVFRKQGRHFLVPPVGHVLEPDTLLDISHESLIRQWQRMHLWLNQEAESAVLYQRIEETAQRWQQGKAALLRSPELEHVLAWRTQAQPTQAWAERYGQHFALALDFLAESDQAQHQEAKAIQKRRRVTLASMAGGLIIAIILTLISVFFGLDASQQRKTAEASLAKAEQEKKKAKEQTKIALVKKLGAQAIIAAKLPSSTNGSVSHALLFAAQSFKMDTTEQAILLRVMQDYPKIKTHLYGHTQDVRSVAISPDGKHLASASADQTVRLWDIETQAPFGKPLLGHTDSVTSVAFSPNGRYLASASEDKSVRLWEIETQTAFGSPLLGHSDSVMSVTFSPDGNRLASGSKDHTVRLWDIEKQARLGEPLLGHTRYVLSVAFSPDGKLLASGSRDETVRLWDIEKQAALGEPLLGHDNWVRNVAFSSDGKYLASCSEDQSVRLWDVKKQVPFGDPLRGHTDYVLSVAFHPNGKHLASASSDKTVRLWNIETQTALGKPMKGHASIINSLAFSPDGKHLASGSEDKTVILWNIEKQVALGEFLQGHIDQVRSVAFSPDGKYLASASSDKTIKLWNIETQTVLGKPLEGHEDEVTSVAFSPNGKYLASASKDKTVRLWNLEKQAPFGKPMKNHTSIVWSVAFSPDGKLLASGSSDRNVILWDVKTQVPLSKPLEGHIDAVRSVAFSPDGKLLASASFDNVRLWDVEKQTPLGEALRGHSSYIYSVAFSPDGKRLASASYDKTVRLWDVEKQIPLGEPLRGHTSLILSVTFSPDGKLLASGSGDKSIILWDIETRNPIAEPLQGHSDFVLSVTFSPDGKLLASGSFDKTVILWDINPNSWLKKACRIANRNLSQEEWREYIGKRPFEKISPDLPKDTLGAMERIKDGEKLAKNGEVEKAVMQFKKARELDARYVIFDPETKAKQLMAKGLVERGQQLAKTGKIEAAIAQFKKAQSLDANLSFDSKKEAKRFSVQNLLKIGKEFAKQGEMEKAIAKYQEVEQMGFSSEISAEDWNTLCRHANAERIVKQARLICNKAIELEPYTEYFRDDRAIARALSGDRQGAIEDLEFYVEHISRDDARITRQKWLDALKKGENPFTEKVLNGLR